MATQARSSGRTPGDSLYRRWGYLPVLLRFLWTLSPGDVVRVAAVAVLRGPVPVAIVAMLQGLVDSAAGVIRGEVGFVVPVLWLLGMLGFTFLMKTFDPINQWVGEQANGRLTMRAQERLLAQTASLPLAAFESPEAFDLMMRAQRTLDSRVIGMMLAPFYVLTNVIICASLLAYVASAQVIFPIILLVGLIPANVVQTRLGWRAYMLEREQTPAERLLSYLEGLLVDRQAAAEIRLYDLAEHLQARHARLFRELQSRRLGLARWGFRANLLGALADQLTYALVITGVVAMVVVGSLTIGYFAAYLAAAESFRLRLWSLLGSVAGIDRDLRYVGDLLDYLGTGTTLTPPLAPLSQMPARRGAAGERPGVRASPDHPAIRFESVAFTYPGSEHPVLSGVDLTIKSGERVALVGENGAGKTTLAKLLLGLYQPTAGRILIDGRDLAEIHPDEWRGKVAAVFQDFVQYQLTVRENVGFGDLRRLDDLPAIQAAALRSGADSLAAGLARGYETVLGKAYDEHGEDLSLGQWQKLAIARAYLRDASVLVLDEPTAALDARAEVEVYRQFRDMSEGRSVLLISHRLGSARLADRILVLAGGQIAEEGSHAELVAKGGRYAEMYAVQAGWYQ